MTLLEAVTLVAVVCLALGGWWLYRRRASVATIRTRLLVGFIAIALLPAIGISLGVVAIGYLNAQGQALERLESVAALKAAQIVNWIHALQDDLVSALNEEYAPERASIVLSLANDSKYSDLYFRAMRNRFQRFVEQTQRLREIFLLDLNGRVVLSTDTPQEGSVFAGQPFFRQGAVATYAQLPFEPMPDRERSVVVSMPVLSNQGQLLGVMAGRADANDLRAILEERTGLGRTGKTYLANTDHLILLDESLRLASDGNVDQPAHSTGIDAALSNQSNGAGSYADYRGVQVVGVYRWIPEFRLALLAEQDQSEAFDAVATTLAVNVGIALASALLAVGLSLVVARGIAAPLVNLVGAAREIAAGDLDRTASVQRADEIGELAQAFNTMTGRLRGLINTLEERVRDRTQTLRQRALQLETSARVSREITSILEIDVLLNRVVELIRDAFGYYHVNVFLVDAAANQLILRASSGASRPAVESLPIGGQGLNTEVAETDRVMLINDVSQEPRFLPDAQLPDTRSELVVPMRVAERVIGTLDVHSTDVNAFTPEDGLVIQSLGDQIAIAIENARLYDSSRELAVLEERHRLARELHDSVTQSLFSLDLVAKTITTYLRRDPEQAEVRIQRMRQITHDTLQEMRSVIFDLRPPNLEQDGLIVALRQHVNRMRWPSGPEIDLETTGERRLPLSVEKELFRIAQEAINNALKHSGAQHVNVVLTLNGGQAMLQVSDDGRGFDVNAPPADRQAFGLIGMRERAQALNGRFEIASAPDQGTRVEVRLPLSDGGR